MTLLGKVPFRWRLVLALFTVGGLGLGFLGYRLTREIRVFYLQAIETGLIETSATLAEMLGASKVLMAQPLQTPSLHDVPSFWGVQKKTSDLIVYVTDEHGKVLAHSTDPSLVGQDFSKWNDVHLTLQGKYGARATRANPSDPDTSVLYVAAPIRHAGVLNGVVSVGLPVRSVSPFLDLGRRTGLILLGTVLILSLAVFILTTRWLTRPIDALVAYTRAVAAGDTPKLPAISSPDLRDMGLSIQSMQFALEGRKHLAQFAEGLVHELRSPLTAIRGAAELLESPLPETKRKELLQIIQIESLRLSQTADRILTLSGVESLEDLSQSEIQDVCLGDLVRSEASSAEARAKSRGISIHVTGPNPVISGDPFLIGQAVGNLLSNAIDFSPNDGRIEVTIDESPDAVGVTVRDQGPGLPTYATTRVFERFYSLPRPATGRRSFGLGLPFVKQVALLHGGEIEIQNVQVGADGQTGGASAHFRLFKNRPNR